MNVEKKAHDLSLADGQKWRFASKEEANDWLDELASIMSFKKADSSNHRPEVCFSYSDPKQKRYSNLIYTFRNKSYRFWPILKNNPKHKKVVTPAENTLRYLAMRKALYPVYSKTLSLKGLPIHAALIKYNRNGFLLSGASRSGKSTSCRLLEPPWEALCDDEALIVYNNKKRYMVHPFPTWSNYYFKKRKSDRNYDVNRYVPLKAVFFLKKAKKDGISFLPKHLAVMRLYHSARQILCITRNNIGVKETLAIRKKVFNNACELIKHVPAYILHVDLNGKFWKLIEEII